MTVPAALSRLLDYGPLNFVLTNCLPRRWLTRLVGRISKSEHPLVRSVSIGLWRVFSGLDLSEAERTHFRSMHDCFTRRLKAGARPIDADAGVVTSPSDGIIGACGSIENGALLQAKRFRYTAAELLGDADLAARFRHGRYVTLRLTSSMYHRFHAPHDCRITRVTHFPGDVWNVNPAALSRVERLFCRNERAVIVTELLPEGPLVALVPVAAILVAGIRLHCLDLTLNLDYRGPRAFRCDASFAKGEELGWFEHGSTIVMLVPPDLDLAPEVRQGSIIRVGQALFRLPHARSELSALEQSAIQ